MMELTMDNTSPRLPESTTVLRTNATQEVVHLLVDFSRRVQISFLSILRNDQMIAMDSRRNRKLGKTGRHELDHCHLRRGILTSDASWTELEIGITTTNVCFFDVVDVAVEELLAVR